MMLLSSGIMSPSTTCAAHYWQKKVLTNQCNEDHSFENRRYTIPSTWYIISMVLAAVEIKAHNNVTVWRATDKCIIQLQV